MGREQVIEKQRRGLAVSCQLLANQGRAVNDLQGEINQGM